MERKREEALLLQARKIREVLHAAKVAPAPEPKRGKTHWDCVLEEMGWLSKEFARERVWKLKTAKRVAVAAQRSNLDLESRVVVRQREEEKTIRKRAAWIAKEVMGFWEKAQRVVMFKVRTEVEARKKEVMDRQVRRGSVFLCVCLSFRVCILMQRGGGTPEGGDGPTGEGIRSSCMQSMSSVESHNVGADCDKKREVVTASR